MHLICTNFILPVHLQGFTKGLSASAYSLKQILHIGTKHPSPLLFTSFAKSPLLGMLGRVP